MAQGTQNRRQPLMYSISAGFFLCRDTSAKCRDCEVPAPMDDLIAARLVAEQRLGESDPAGEVAIDVAGLDAESGIAMISHTEA